MSIVVFWLEADGTAARMEFAQSDLSAALRACEDRRSAGMRHVCISSEMDASVGKAGVASVEGGRLPDGQVYDFDKSHRGAGPRS
jgi:hypothetical protein